jgi:prepilin-type N-terminal cleavage/methylation domain-containing protein
MNSNHGIYNSTHSERASSQSGMTLVEILVSLVILLLVLMAVFPLFTQSINVTTLSNVVTSNLLASQEDIEIVAATRAGVLFADGTFIPNASFPVIFPDGETPCPGMTVKKDKLVRFLASIPHIKTTSLHEGYSPDEAQITINGYNTNFIDTNKTEIEILDKNGDTVTGYSDYTVLNKNTVTLTLPTDSNRLNNLNSPYTITLRTGNEQVTSLLPIYLPRAIAFGGDTMLISSVGNYWVSKADVSFDSPLNDIVYWGDSEDTGAFIAIGDEGSIYSWFNQEPWREIDHLLTTHDLNDIIVEKGLFIVVGDKGTILTSHNGTEWSKENTPVNTNLRSITYSPAVDSFICVGDGGTILTSSDGESWQQSHTWPRLAKGSLNGQNAVYFSGNGDYLTTISPPVIASNNRTVFMIVGPEEGTDSTMLSWGAPLDKVSGGRFTLKLDRNRLSLEQGQGNQQFISTFTIPNNEPSLVISRLEGDRFNNYSLYYNGEKPQNPNANPGVNTGNHFPMQIGSDPLTRYNSPLPFRGLIAEILIFDRALSIDRVTIGSTQYASEMDIVRKYFGDKYGVNVDPLEDVNLSNLIDPVSDEPLADITVSESRLLDLNGVALWLNAADLQMNNNEQVPLWEDRSTSNNHASGASLLTVASSNERIIAAGYHCNVMYSEDGMLWNPSASVTSNDKMAAEYRFDSVLFTGEKYIALVNDGLDNYPPNKANGLIFSSTDGLTWSYTSYSNMLNDLDYLPAGNTLMAVGNNRTIILSEDGSNWRLAQFEFGIDSGLDLQVGLIR